MKLALLLLCVSAPLAASDKIEKMIKSGNHVAVSDALHDASRTGSLQLSSSDTPGATRKRITRSGDSDLEVTQIITPTVETFIKLAEQQVAQKQANANSAVNFDRVKRALLGLILIGAGGFKTYTDATAGVYKELDLNSVTQATASAGFMAAGFTQFWAAITNQDALAKVANAKAVQRDIQTFKNDMTKSSAVLGPNALP